MAMALFSGHEFQIFIGLLASLLAGFLIGAERESRGKPAGISTNCFVIGGAMIFATFSAVIDPFSQSRIAAQIVSGVGFLGAGIIMKGNDGVITNLTTAASIWFSASVGLAIGYQWYIPAGLAVIYAVLVPKIPHLNKNHPYLKKTRNTKEEI